LIGLQRLIDPVILSKVAASRIRLGAPLLTRDARLAAASGHKAAVEVF
jgi:hypothetical protein